MWESNRITQEEPPASFGLVRICVFTAFGFGLMALMVEDKGPVLFIGACIVAAVAIYGLWLHFQSRYGQATLEVTSPFQYGTTFSGIIETELMTAGKGPVRIRVSAGNKIARNRGDHFSVRQKVPQTQLQRSKQRGLRIPFSVEIPRHTPGEYDEVRLEARTSAWPVGWGATFVVVPAGYVPILDDILSE